MKWAKKLFISLSIAVLVVGCGAVLLFNWSALGFKTLAVPTGSMRPAITPGSLVLMHRVPVSTLKVGDVITYTSPQNMRKTITHRIVRVEMLGERVLSYQTKGDANPSPDPWIVPNGLVRGKVVWHIAYIGKAMLWSKTWTGIAILIYIPALLVMIEEVRRLQEYLRKFMPYQSFEYLSRFPAKRKTRLVPATMVSFAIIAGSALIAFPAQALLRSNTVTLGPNNLKVAAIHQCSGSTTNNNNTTITNTNNQTATSGDVNNSNNTTTGNSTSGNASNSNSTTITVTNTNCH